MSSEFRIYRSDGVVVMSGLDATDASMTLIDAPPAGTYTYYLQVTSSTGVSRTMTLMQAVVFKK
jgi:hypothetical protein